MAIKLIEDSITWKENLAGDPIKHQVDVRLHPRPSHSIVLIIPGIDGSVDGYKDKYIKMAEKILTEQHKSVIRVSNPYISQQGWGDNIDHIMQYIHRNSRNICGEQKYDLEIIAHSAGASVVAWMAHEYPEITKLVLINMSANLQPQLIKRGLRNYSGKTHIVYGDQDPSIDFANDLAEWVETHIIRGADHQFTGKHFDDFINTVDLLSTTKESHV